MSEDKGVKMLGIVLGVYEGLKRVAKKLEIGMTLIPVNEYSFFVIFQYDELKEVIKKIVEEKFANTPIELDGNVLELYFANNEQKDIREDIQKLITRISQKYKMKMTYDISDDGKMITVFMKLQPLVLQQVDRMFLEVKKIMGDKWRMFKTSIKEVNMKDLGIDMGYSLVVLVKYKYGELDKIQNETLLTWNKLGDKK